MKITIHRALAEIKLINKKLTDLMGSINPIAITQKDRPISGYMKEDEFISKSKSDFDSYLSLSKRRGDIKLAIIKSNAVTYVEVGKRKMTVADAIIEKVYIQDKVSFISRLQKLNTRVLADMEDKNARVEENLQRLIEVTYGSDKSKIKKDDYEAIATPFNDKNQFILVDPLKLKDKIDAMQSEVDEFLSNVDSVLSESNATTLIDISE